MCKIQGQGIFYLLLEQLKVVLIFQVRQVSETEYRVIGLWIIIKKSEGIVHL